MLALLEDLLFKQMMSRQPTIELKCVIILFQIILLLLLQQKISLQKHFRKILNIVSLLMKFLLISFLPFLFQKHFQLLFLHVLLILTLCSNISKLLSSSIEIALRLKEHKEFLRKVNQLRL